ncbi:MAG: hypothetical protein AAGJ37_09830 [Pseudomonadota bacterium]
MFEMYIVGLFAAIHVLFAIKAATSTKLLNPQKRSKWIMLSLAFGFVGHFIYYSLQLDDEYQAMQD